ncbi:MAG: dipeptidase [Gemmatimonadota bacterium]|nr:dipeptidase [Gemmatimonadota bacterium]
MDRRDLLKGLVAAGVAPVLPSSDGPTPPERDEARQDSIIVEGLFAGTMRLSHLRGMQEGGVDCGVAGGPSDMSSFAGLLRFFDAHSDEVVLAKSVAEIRQARREGKISNVFCWQSAGALGADFNSPLGSAQTALRAFHEVGLRIIGLCYNVVNVFGGGCLEPEVGLTRAGRRLVEEIHSLGMVLDVGGHTGERTTLDAIEMSRGVPVVCTHTNVAAIADNWRCSSDRVIDAIAATGGVIGITAVNDFHVRGKGVTGPVPHIGIEEHVDQYDYIKRRVGVDHVGMGTDFIDGMPIPYEGGVNTEIITADMVDTPWRYVRGFESIAELPNLVGGLQARGWTDEEVGKAMGGNWLRVYEQVWGG